MALGSNSRDLALSSANAAQTLGCFAHSWQGPGRLLLLVLVEQYSSPPSILLVDDNRDDLLLIVRAFERAGLKHLVQTVSSGAECIGYLKGEPPYSNRTKYPVPGLVLLDLKMIGTDGFGVLRWIRNQPQYANLYVVMLTSSDEIRDVNQAYKLGADSFLVKPLDFWNAAELSRSLQKLMAKPHPH